MFSLKPLIERPFRFILSTVFGRVIIAMISHAVQSISPKMWDFIEHKVFNPYEFGDHTVDYYRGIFSKLEKIFEKNAIKLKGKSFLELGPGGFLGIGAFLKSSGVAPYYALDTVNHFEHTHENIYDYYRSIDRSSVEGKSLSKDYFQILLYNGGDIPLESGSIDITYSHYVYEHVQNPEVSISEIGRITKSGGYSIHEIGYLDHIFSGESLFYRTIPDWLYNGLFRRSGGWVNRKTHAFFREAFIKAGFEVIEEEIIMQYRKDMVESYIRKLPQYTKDDLGIAKGIFILRKK